LEIPLRYSSEAEKTNGITLFSEIRAVLFTSLFLNVISIGTPLLALFTHVRMDYIELHIQRGKRTF